MDRDIYDAKAVRRLIIFLMLPIIAENFLQIFTDLLAAKNAKIRMILVNPINTKIENNFFKVKRFLEKLVYKRRI